MSQAKPSQAKPSQAKPSQAKPSQAKPSQVIAFMDTESHSSGNNIDISPCMRTGDCARVSVVIAVDGGNQAASENVHHSLRTGRDSGDAVVIPINADADRQNSAALTPSPDAEGRIRLRDPGIGVGENGDPMFTMQATKPHAVAFKPSHYTRGKDGKPTEVTPPLSADTDKGDQDTVVAAVAFNNTGAGWWNDQEQVAATVRRECDRASVMATAVVSSPDDAEAFQTRIARCGRGQPEPISPALNGSDSGATSDMRPCVRQEMQVRRLTPKECCRLQGFPDDYLDISYKGKPAADGPKYRALGNSMAVPCMWWLGYRIHKATESAT